LSLRAGFATSCDAFEMQAQTLILGENGIGKLPIPQQKEGTKASAERFRFSAPLNGRSIVSESNALTAQRNCRES
jgi:hypothetical protein